MHGKKALTSLVILLFLMASATSLGAQDLQKEYENEMILFNDLALQPPAARVTLPDQATRLKGYILGLYVNEEGSTYVMLDLDRPVTVLGDAVVLGYSTKHYGYIMLDSSSSNYKVLIAVCLAAWMEDAMLDFRLREAVGSINPVFYVLGPIR